MNYIGSDSMTVDEFLGRLVYWCFKSGIEFKLTNKAHNFPVMDVKNDVRAVGEFHERDRDGNLVDMAHRTNHKIIEIPELIFSRGEKHVSIFAYDWSHLMYEFERQYKRVFADLCVPNLEWRKK